MVNVIAIITARGGSKGLPQKNILDLAGKPLITHTILAALDSCVFSKVLVTTEDKSIKNIALEYGAAVIDRPEHLATDTASSLDVIAHTLHTLGANAHYTHFILLQPTSPLRKSLHIVEAWETYQNHSIESLVSVTKEPHSPHKLLIEEDDKFKPLFNIDSLTMPRQLLPQAYRPNGAIYISSIDTFEKSKNLFNEPLGIYIMSEEDSIDIDTKDDLLHCEKILKATRVDRYEPPT